MRVRKLGTLFTIVQIVAVIVCLSLSALAQQPAPSPPPAPAGNTLPDLFQNLAMRAASLIPLLQNEIEKPMLPWLEKLSWALAGLILYFSFARIWRENGGAGVDLFWWFGRVAVCLALVGSGPVLINKLGTIGHEMASGSNSVLGRLYGAQRLSFEASYRKFAEGHFTVKPTGENIKPLPSGEEALLGVLHDVTSSPKDVNRKLETLSRDLPTLFMFLSAARGIIDFGDLYLLILGYFLMIVVRLAAPIMIALAIDRELARKISYPYLWGTIVLTLIWPVVSQLIRALAFLGGNLAMALDAGDSIYKWDPRTLQEITNGFEHPFYTVMLAAAIMMVAGLSLWMSPYIAYKLSIGQIYESVSSTISGWVGGMVGAGVQLYSSALSSSIIRQADNTQAEGVRLGEVTRAAAGQESGNMRDRAAKIAAIQGAEGALKKDLAQIEGGRVQTTKGIEAEQQFGLDSVEAQTELEKSNIWARKDQRVAELEAQNARESANIDSDRQRATKELYGDIARDAGNVLGDAAGAAGPKGQVVGAGAKAVGAGVDDYLTYKAIQEDAGRKQGALGKYTKDTIDIEGAAATRFDRNQNLYREKMEGAIKQRAINLTGAANEGAAISAGGAKDGYNIAVGGYNQAYKLNLQANAVNYAGAVKAAGQVRDASVEAAKLRAAAAVIGSVGHNIARDMEQGMTLRY